MVFPGTVIVYNCYSQYTQLHNLSLSVSISKYNYEAPFSNNCCLVLIYYSDRDVSISNIQVHRVRIVYMYFCFISYDTGRGLYLDLDL